MKKLTLTFVLLLFLTACSRQKPAAQGYTFTDDLGREVTVSACERTAALLGSYADIWYLAGGSVIASAEDAWEDFDLPLSQDAVNLGATKKLSLESLLAAKPDFVLASTNTPQHVQWRQTLEQAGITVAYFDVSDFDDYLRMLKVCTALTGKPDRYKEHGEALQRKIAQILERNDGAAPQTVLVMRASAASIRAKNSDGTVLGTMLRDFGCINIADSDEMLLENLSVESILLRNPDKIFIIQTGSDMEAVKDHVYNVFRENPLWQELDAVKNDRLYFMDKRLFNLKPNARWAEAYEVLEEILYENPS